MEMMSPCDHAKVVEEINRAQELMTQLRALVLPCPLTDGKSEMARDLFEEVLRSLTVVLFDLQPGSQLGSPYLDGGEKTNGFKGKRKNLEDRDKSDGHKRSRKLKSWTSVTSVPHVDGHQWRKYGQKPIISTTFPRSYYRCTHYKDHGCPARKTVQQKDGNDDPPKYIVAYQMQHTCKTLETNSEPLSLDSLSQKPSVTVLESASLRSQQENPSLNISTADSQASTANHDLRDLLIPPSLAEPTAMADDWGVMVDMMPHVDPWNVDMEWIDIDDEKN